jgi:hypothetical protein
MDGPAAQVLSPQDDAILTLKRPLEVVLSHQRAHQQPMHRTDISLRHLRRLKGLCVSRATCIPLAKGPITNVRHDQLIQ